LLQAGRQDGVMGEGDRAHLGGKWHRMNIEASCFDRNIEACWNLVLFMRDYIGLKLHLITTHTKCMQELNDVSCLWNGAHETVHWE
jgi:hypothetical protein